MNYKNKLLILILCFLSYSGIFANYFDDYCNRTQKEWNNTYFKNDHNKYLLFQQPSNDSLDGNIITLANNLYLGNQGGKIVGNNDAPVNLGGMIYFFITKKKLPSNLIVYNPMLTFAVIRIKAKGVIIKAIAFDGLMEGSAKRCIYPQNAFFMMEYKDDKKNDILLTQIK